MRRLTVFILCLIGSVGLAAPALACADAESNLNRALRHIPADAEIVVSVGDLTRLRQTAIGKAGASTVASALPLAGDLGGAWSRLSSTLDLEPGAAFDALLGERVTIVASRREGVWDASSWLLMTRVSAQTQERVRKRLDVAPRKILAGHTLYSIETGRLELSFIERAGNGADALLAPAGSPLLDRVVLAAAKNEGGPSILTTPRGKAATALDAPDILAIVSIPPREDGAERWATLGARFEPSGDIVASFVGAGRHDADDAAPWTSAEAAHALDGVALGLLGSKGSLLFAAAESAVFRDAGAADSLKDKVRGVTTGRVAILVLTPGEGEPLPIITAMELRDLRQGAVAIDAALAESLQAEGVDAPDFGGLFPEAVRKIDAAEGAAWTYRTAPGDPADGEEAQPAWWILSSAERGIEAATSRLFGAQATPSPVPQNLRSDADLISVGIVRPPRLLNAVFPEGALPPMLAPLERIEAVRVWEQAPVDGVIHGGAVLRLRKEEASPKASQAR